MANFCTMNPLAANGTTFSEGNTKCAGTSATNYNARTFATMYPSSGKYYWEITQVSASTSNYATLGICSSPTAVTTTSANPTNTSGTQDVTLRLDGNLYDKGGAEQLNWAGSSASTGDVFMIALDVDSGKVWIGKNNSWFASGNPAGDSNPAASSLTGPLGPCLRNTNGTFKFNFGQLPWRYTPPTGFVALSTDNLSEPSISNLVAEKPEDYFKTVTYTGTGVKQTISGLNLGTAPGLIWIKDRSAANNHVITDTVVGVDRIRYPNLTSVDGVTGGGWITAPTTTSFAVDINGPINTNGNNYVAWVWAGGGDAVENTDGSITSQVSANQEAGFSIVSYTGTGGSATVGHGLGAVPKFIIIKNRTVTNSWVVHHTSCTSGNVYLNSTNAQGAGKDVNSSSTTTFSLSTWDAANGGNNPMIAYCWAEVEGYSSIGNYTGNGSADGPFVYTGFRPALIIRKAYSTTENWTLVDNERNTYNPVTYFLRSDETSSDSTGAANVDFLADGFKMRTSDPKTNGSGVSYLYVAFAESPFKYAAAR